MAEWTAYTRVYAQPAMIVRLGIKEVSSFILIRSEVSEMGFCHPHADEQAALLPTHGSGRGGVRRPDPCRCRGAYLCAGLSDTT